MRYLIAANRDRWILRLAAHAARAYLDRFENLNYDPELNGERFVLERIASTGPRQLIDVGANVGEWALLAHALIPTARIDCLEILPRTAELLSRRVAGVAQIAVHPFGLSDADQTVPLDVFADLGHTAIAGMTFREGGAPASGRTITGDRFLAESAIDHVDLLKIDVEGAEYRVLAGFDRALRDRRIDMVQFEYGPASIVTRHLLRDHHSLLAELGYVVGKIYPGYVDFRTYRPADEDFRGPNYLAVRSERSDLLTILGR